MTSYVVYTSDGEIVRSGISQNGHIELQAFAGEFVLHGEGRNQTHYVKNGELVAYTVEQAAEKGKRPFFSKWSNETFSWTEIRSQERLISDEWGMIRAERDRLIAATDWTQLPDVPLATRDAWAIYRQAMRDITLQPDPFNIVWPTPPQS